MTSEKINGHDNVFKLLADAVQEHLHTTVDLDTVNQIVDRKLAEIRVPRPIEVRQQDGTAVTLKDRAHRQFEELLDLYNEGHVNLLMVGPAGTGKTTLAKTLAEALGLPFGFISLSAGVTETHLFGRVLPHKDGSWKYRATLFVKMYVKGGVFLLDELDAADANLMVAINAALANGVLVNPVNGKIYKRHPKFILIAAANTWGRGADSVYAGRNQLDGSTLDRFVMSTLRVEYDTDLERDLAHGLLGEDQAESVLYWVNSLREKITQHRLRRIASTRLVINACKALKTGKTLDQVKARYFQDWSTDEQAKIQR